MTETGSNRNGQIPYRVVRSRRRTIGLEVGADGAVTVRMPQYMAVSEAGRFVEEKKNWIRKSQERMENRRRLAGTVDLEKQKRETVPWISGEGGELFLSKVREWAEKMGVTYAAIRIRDMRTRWGSCSAKKNLSFSWRVFTMPERLVDYLIVHELAHLKRMDHSPAFWQIVRQYVPEYKTLKKELNGMA